MAEKVRHTYLECTSLLCALGDLPTSVDCMAEGISGLRYSDRFGMMTGEIDASHPDAQPVDGFSRFESLVIRQLERIKTESKVRFEDEDVVLIVSTTKGNVELLAESLDPIPERAFIAESVQRVASRLGFRHRPIVVSNACISGVSAFVVARELIRRGEYRHAVVVGCDVLSEFITKGFASFKSISENPCRPYDAACDGLTLGEACGVAVVTSVEEYASEPRIEIAGGATANDANHISGPSRTGDGLYYAINAAMLQAGVSAESVGLVNTHGTATLYNDEMESKAVAWAGLESRPLNSLKGYIGHTLGASGVVESILCAEQLRRGVAFATKGFASQGTPIAVGVSSNEQEITSACCVKTASGFGGCNAAIVLSMGVGSGEQSVAERQTEVCAEYVLPHTNEPFDEFIRREFKSFEQPNMKFYKMSNMCKALYVAVQHLLAQSDLEEVEPRRRAIVLANSAASLDADADHQRIANQHAPEGTSPAVFVYTLPNVAAGEMCIRHRLQGDNTFFVESDDSGLAERYAHHLIASDRADVAICGWCDLLDNEYKVEVKLIKLK